MRYGTYFRRPVPVARTYYTARTAPYYGVGISITPPAPRYESYGRAPSSRHFWVNGRWAFVNGRYTWVGGHWDTMRNGQVYVQGHWNKVNGQWYYQPGHWK